MELISASPYHAGGRPALEALIQSESCVSRIRHRSDHTRICEHFAFTERQTPHPSMISTQEQ